MAINIGLLTSSRPSDEPEIVELGHLVLHDGRAVAQLRTVVLIVARPQCHDRPVRHVAQRDHLYAVIVLGQSLNAWLLLKDADVGLLRIVCLIVVYPTLCPP